MVAISETMSHIGFSSSCIVDISAAVRVGSVPHNPPLVGIPKKCRKNSDLKKIDQFITCQISKVDEFVPLST